MNYNLLVNTMSIQTESYNSVFMERYIKKHLKKNNIDFECDQYGNIYATKGKASLYPTMVCHVDTVHDINMNSVVKRHKDILYSIDSKTFQRTGIGGDDKVGVFITLSCLEYFDNFKAVFFKDEEVGCVGSSHADFSFFDDSTIVLQCDRKGMGDFVSEIYGIDLCDEQLLSRIEDVLDEYNRKPVSGGLTDVKQIALNNNVQVANVNCGYYSPHTDDEYISISDVHDTLNFCIEVFISTMFNRITMERKPYEPIMYTSSHVNSYYYGYEDEWYSNTNTPKSVCNKCKSIDTDYDPYMNQTYCYTCDEYEDIQIEETNSQSITTIIGTK